MDKLKWATTTETLVYADQSLSVCITIINLQGLEVGTCEPLSLVGPVRCMHYGPDNDGTPPASCAHMQPFGVSAALVPGDLF